MLEGVIEAGIALARLRKSVEDASLRHAEIEVMLGLPPGGWDAFARGAPIGALRREQEARGRLATELLRTMSSRLGDAVLVGSWLRAPNPELDGASPLDWIAAEPLALRALVRAVRFP